MDKNKYEYPLPIGTIIVGGYMSSTTDKERYQYRVDEVLGQGGFGITYKVSSKIKIGNVWQKQRVTFAIKEHFVRGHCYRGSDGITVEYSKASAAEVEDSLKDFLKEGERLGKICVGCENIVNVNEVIQTNNTAYYVMEYIEGGDLRQCGRINEDKALEYIFQISKAVDYLHKQKVLHLDIKPENVVLTQNQDGRLIPVLIDFGVARYFSSKGGLTTTHKAISASNGYAPIEQYNGVETFAPEVDVYALGATLFYMLVGRDPLSSFDRIKLPPGDIEKALPETISEQTKDALENAMKVQAFERTKNVATFVSELKGKKKEVPQTPPPSEKQEEPIQPVQENLTKRLAPNSHSQSSPFIKVLVGLVAFVLLIGFLLWRNNSSEVVPPETGVIDSVATDITSGDAGTISTGNNENVGRDVNGSNSGKDEAIKEPPVIEEPIIETDESIFSRASLNKDWNTILDLAKKRYTPACGKLARYYIGKEANQENHCRAYYWAKKAAKNDKDYVMDVLQKYGFLIDGEPVTSCDINYNVL